MKKFLLLGLLSMLWRGLWADNVSQEKAEQWAVRFFEQKAQARSGGVQLRMVWNGEEGTSRGSAQPAFYVFNRTDRPGFVIVAGDDLVAPVLGYSFEHPFRTEGMPENIRLWLLNRKSEINEVRAQGEKGGATAEWNLSRSIGRVEKVMHTAQWNQNDPYNRECPNVNGKKAYTGCTATAIAIAMRYRQWPDQGEGTLPMYTYRRSDGRQFLQNERQLNQPYNWDNMPLEVSGATSEASKNEIARLMMDVAVMCKSSFDRDAGTGAIAQQTHNGLAKYMKYSKQMRWLDRDSYGFSAWCQMVKDELYSNGPVVYTGSSKNTAHAFVLDGYTSNNHFSVNWGWGGSNNGFFQLTAMNPSPGGIGGGEYSYNMNQSALFHMKKAASGEVAPQEQTMVMKVGVNKSSNQFEFGLRSWTRYISAGTRFDVQAGQIYNESSRELKVVIGVGMFDKNGRWKQKVSQTSSDIWTQGYVPGTFYQTNKFLCVFNGQPEEGDYLALIYKNQNTEDWYEADAAFGAQRRIPLLQADERPTMSDAFFLTPGGGKVDDFHGIYSDERKIVPQKDFNVHTGYLRSLSSSYRGKLAVCQFDVRKKFKAVVSKEREELLNPPMGSILDEKMMACRIEGDIEKGDFLALAYMNSITGEWSRIYGIDFVTARIELEASVKPEPEIDLEAETSLLCDMESKRLEVKTHPGTDYVLKTEGGSVLVSGVSDAQGSIVYQPQEWPVGVVRLELSYRKAKKVITMEWRNE